MNINKTVLRAKRKQRSANLLFYSSFSLSPDKKYMLLCTIRKPFSYMVRAYGFPSLVSITDLTGKVVKVLARYFSHTK